jgi:hypothetical protein
MGLISSSWEHSRIVVLAAHCLLTSINSFQWANYFPVPDQAQTVFGMNLSQVNVLLLVYTVVWLPIMPMSVPLQQATGPYGPLIVGSALNLLAAVVKLMSLFWFPAFAPAVIAQALAGAGEVFFLPLPALILRALGSRPRCGRLPLRARRLPTASVLPSPVRQPRPLYRVLRHRAMGSR